MTNRITVIANIERLYDESGKFHHVDKYQLDHQDEGPTYTNIFQQSNISFGLTKVNAPP